MERTDTPRLDPVFSHLPLLIQKMGSYPHCMMDDWSTEELFEGEDFFHVPEATECFTVVPAGDGIGETTVFADGSYVQDWRPGTA